MRIEDRIYWLLDNAPCPKLVAALMLIALYLLIISGGLAFSLILARLFS